MNWPSASSEIGTIATARPVPPPYIGRFAPSPTGPLHFGSLLAAVASYLEARQRNGLWHVRLEDIDPPREEPGATDRIIAALTAYGFEWDGAITFQSASRDAHEAALRQLAEQGQTYRCTCSRNDLADAPRGPLGIIYPGHCRAGAGPGEAAVRVRTTGHRIGFTDRLQGPQAQALARETGDFVVRRRDGLIAYHLAVVVDDELQGVTEIVRGIDLMDSTPRQVWLQRLLGYRTPAYAHIPVAINSRGQKLSKSHGASPVPTADPAPVLAAALAALGQDPPAALARRSIGQVWSWALENWRLEVLTDRRQIPPADAGAGPGMQAISDFNPD